MISGLYTWQKWRFCCILTCLSWFVFGVDYFSDDHEESPILVGKFFGENFSFLIYFTKKKIISGYFEYSYTSWFSLWSGLTWDIPVCVILKDFFFVRSWLDIRQFFMKPLQGKFPLQKKWCFPFVMQVARVQGIAIYYVLL